MSDLICELARRRARACRRRDRREIGLDHPRAGELVVLSQADSWFAYPYWLDDRLAPDFARTVDIHRKPGYDPCELFFDPGLWWPKGRAIRRLVQKKLGFRTLFDVIPLDPALVRGSHGVPAARPEDRPILIGDGPPPRANGLDSDDRGPRPAAAGPLSRLTAAVGDRWRRIDRSNSPPCRRVGSSNVTIDDGWPPTLVAWPTRPADGLARGLTHAPLLETTSG